MEIRQELNSLIELKDLLYISKENVIKEIIQKITISYI